MLDPGDPDLVTDRKKRIERELFLRAMSAARTPPEVARQMASILRDVHLPRGSIVYERGDEPKHAHFVVSGEVTMRAEDEDDLIFGPGSLIGILDLNIGRPRLRTALISADAHLLELPYDGWLEVFEDFPDYTSAARRIVAGGLHDVALTLAPTGGFDQLPPAVDPALDLDVVSRIAMLRRTRCFGTAKIQAIADIAQRGEILRPPTGKPIDPAAAGRGRMYLVMRGSVRIERRVPPVVRATFGPGQIVLAGAAFSDALSTYDATAGEGTAIFALDHAELDDASDDHFDLVRSLLRGMSLDRDQLMTVRARSPGSRKSIPASAAPPRPDR